MLGNVFFFGFVIVSLVIFFPWEKYAGWGVFSLVFFFFLRAWKPVLKIFFNFNTSENFKKLYENKNVPTVK